MPRPPMLLSPRYMFVVSLFGLPYALNSSRYYIDRFSEIIITISRQSGSSGRTISKEAAEKLGILCYDTELIEKLEEATGLSKAHIAERGEYASHGSWLASAFSDRDRNGHSVQDNLWLIQRQVILELAGNGPCVIAGRC